MCCTPRHFNMNLCRLCIKWRNSYVYIFEANRKHGFILADVINDILQLDVSPHDGLPAFVCKQCFDKVIYFKNFKSICQESKRTLKNLVSHHNGVLLQPTYLNQIILGTKNTEIDSKLTLTNKSELVEDSSFEDDSIEENVLTHCPLFVSIHEDDKSPVIYGEDPDEGCSESNNDSHLVQDNIVWQGKCENEGHYNDYPGSFPSSLEVKKENEDTKCDALNLSISSNGNQLKSGVDGRKEDIGMQSYQCDACGETFDSKEVIGRHVVMHFSNESCGIRTDDAQFPCDRCEKDQESAKHLMEQGCICLRNPAPQKPVLPSGRFNLLRESKHQRGTYSRIKPYSCDQCGKSFTTKKYVKVHMQRTHASVRVYNCGVCNKLFAYQRDLVNHMKAHSSIKPFVCDECGRGYKTKYAKYYHTLSCHRNPQLQCKVCSKMFGLKKDLKRHMAVHVSDRPFVCDVCGITFKSTYSLKDHILRCHINFRPHDCKVCCKKFALLKDLTCHMRVHSVGDPVECVDCGKTFKSKKILNEHMLRFHRDVRPHQCQVCRKHFALSKDLKAHMEVHSGTEPFLCDECGKSYKTKYILKKHVLVAHLRHLLPYRCEVCSKRFCDPSSLKAHMAIHSDKRPFACTECGLTYKIKSDLNKHMISIHDKPLE